MVMDTQPLRGGREPFPLAQSERALGLSGRGLKVNFAGDFKRPF